MTSTTVDAELIVHTIDEACQDWPQKFKTTPDELMQAIQKLACDCTRAFIQLSISVDDNQQVKKNQLDAERIVSKVKELRQSLGNLWPSNIDSFGRDVFDVGPYHVVAAEFFHPVPFYPNNDLIMKLYRWSVYDTNRTIISRYHLERSELVPDQPYYVLGKSYSNGHSQIQPYGTTVPDYNQMKNHVISNLEGQGPSPIASLTYPSSEH